MYDLRAETHAARAARKPGSDGCWTNASIEAERARASDTAAPMSAYVVRNAAARPGSSLELARVQPIESALASAAPKTSHEPECFIRPRGMAREASRQPRTISGTGGSGQVAAIPGSGDLPEKPGSPKPL